MDITLISRSFQSHKQGMGSYSRVLYESIKDQKEFNIKMISQDDSIIQNDNALDYLFFSIIELKFKIKKAGVYHALSPIESIYLDPDRSVVTIHDLIPIKMPKLISNGIQAKLLKLFFDKSMKKAIKCKKIIAVSDETARDVQNYYNINIDDIKVIRQAIKSGFFPKNIENEIFTVGTISHLNNRKRVNILIESFLKADIKNSMLLIGGKGPELENLKKISEGDSRIKFLGFISDDKMNDFYNSLDVFVFPTIMEGYGLPIVEAMACEKPVITLDDAFIPDDVKKRTHISNNLAYDLKNRNFKCDIKSNLKFAKEHSLENMNKELLKIYRDIS
ncbi:glycosyltransferase [Methanobrevibacter sp.]|uniref:glycosyltransferase n=1 Tax=Methanobrevibacter sp. TaxID=66852 RepID=UPI00261DBA50|nr:glycosyltransferase [uncultured Methanobrevibacter sp.]